MSQDALHLHVDGDPAGGEPQLESLPPCSGRAALVRQMWHTAEAQVREIEERLQQNRQAPDERERDARVLAVLAKTLRELAALDQANSDAAARAALSQSDDADDDPVPRDIDEFRRELARRIHAFVDSRGGAGLPGDDHRLPADDQ
jgi:hypothetical protein